MGNEFSHIDASGRASMVDVSGKPGTLRTAVARGTVVFEPETLSLIQEGGIPKGNVFNTARVAGLMAAKRTGELIPLCHPLALEHVSIDFATRRDKGRALIEISARARLVGKTGVEMEALTAVAVAALTLYDMCKAVDKTITITDIRLMEKTGGTKK